MRLVYWQNILSPHQSAHIRALAALLDQVVVVAEHDMSPDRRAMGWWVPDFGMAKVVVAPKEDTVQALVREAAKESIHILGGARFTRLGNTAMLHCLREHVRIALMTEAPDPRGLKGWGRRLKYTSERLLVGRHFDVVLAMGQRGVHWYLQCGYPVVFPYAYSVERPPNTSRFRPNRGDTVHLVYVGQCLPHKGGDLLLRALASMRDLKWQLSMIGAGPEAERWIGLACQLSTGARVRFMSSLPHSLVMEEMAQSDLLVLPSRHDGWGAVVNEALMCGVPVICSTSCGASDLLRDPWRGEVFRSGSVVALRDVLRRWISRGKRHPVTTHKIRDWSRCIEGDSLAAYLLAVLHYVYDGGERPTAPWRA